MPNARFARRWMAAALAGLLTMGCGGADSGDPPAGERRQDKTTRPVAEKIPPASKETTAMESTQGPVPNEVMERLYAEVETASGTARDAIVLVRAERSTWRDMALGCPQPNVSYAQMLVAGFWVVLRAGDEEYDFRVDNNLHHRRCTGATKQAPIRFPVDQ